MQTITIQSHVGEDGTLRLDVPTDLSNTDLEVVIWLRPVETTTNVQSESFSQWWAKQLSGLSIAPEVEGEDRRFEYLAERYNL